ncbi:hypothetical protein [Lysinibacillus sp. 3P01SB]|uniref:hypothetical protein n=1 Tax=Lysinibacillus sp. 3P01SB TaxID=3132284 RepID=UPI0039A4B909
MKKTLNKLFLSLTILSFIFMAVLDFFPSIGISPKAAVIGVVVFVILTAVTEYRPYTTATPKKRFRQSLIITHAILAVLILLTLAGGQSQSGISLSNPLLWVLYFFSVFASYIRYKKQPTEA